MAVFTVATQIFDVYCLLMAAPGVQHYGYFLISYDFVFAGNADGQFSFSLFIRADHVYTGLIPRIL